MSGCWPTSPALVAILVPWALVGPHVASGCPFATLGEGDLVGDLGHDGQEVDLGWPAGHAEASNVSTAAMTASARAATAFRSAST